MQARNSAPATVIDLRLYRLSWLPAPSRRGDSVTFVSHLDTVVVLSACPQDLVGINAGAPTDLLLDVLDRP